MTRSWLTALALLLAAGPVTARAECPPQTRWPGVDWNTRAAAVAVEKTTQIKALEDYAFTLKGTDEERLGIRTDGVVIVQDGDVIYERYARGYAPEKKHLSWSVTKTVMNALVGIAVKGKLMKIEDSVCDHFPLVRNENCAITIRHLLEMSSGLDWAETYEGKSNQASSVLAMLYGEGQKDAANFVGAHDPRNTPGATWAYSSGDTNLLSAAVDAVFRKTYPEGDYAWKELFDKLNIRATLERDGRGTPIGSSYWYATPRDLAKFGYLYLNDGCWKDARLFPEGWVADSTKVAPDSGFRVKPLFRDPDDVYGRLLWLNTPVKELEITTPWPDVPEDAYAARGHWGQSITVIPSKKLVVVRVGDDRESGAFSLNLFLQRALAVAE